MKYETEHTLLDLTGYQNRDEAMALAAYGCPKAYTEVAKKHLMGQTNLTTGYLLFGYFVSRMRGLHEGVVREITNNNPHAVLPLTRSWVEAITIGLYVLRHLATSSSSFTGPATTGPLARASSRCSTP